MPTTRMGDSRSSSPASRAVSAATKGTPATSSPVSEDDNSCSAQESSTQGIVISSTVKSRNGRQCRRSADPSRPRATVHGISRTAPTTQRRKTTTTGENPPTATLINRYGTPQIRDIARNSAQPRRLTLVLPTSSSPGHHGRRQRHSPAWMSPPGGSPSPLGAHDALDADGQEHRQQQPAPPL